MFDSSRAAKDSIRGNRDVNTQSLPTGSNMNAGIELDLLDKKIRRLVCKLKKHNVCLEVFEHKDIQYGALLGRGGEGMVQQCTVLYNNLRVEAAVKTVLDSSDDAISITLDEIELLCLGWDPIVDTTLKVYGVAAIPEKDDPELGHLAIITEPGVMNSLQLYQQEEVPPQVTYDLWGRLAGAVYCMHTKRIIHQDLKPENILVTRIGRDSNGQIVKIDFKIIDLGMGKRVFSEKVVTEDILGTNGYHAPEVLFEDSYDFRADIFMLGITFCVLLHPPNFLRANKLQSLLTGLHDAKHKKQAGAVLFNKILQPSIDECHDITSGMKKMICQMLEEQSKRHISLLDVRKICMEEAQRVQVEQLSMPPVLSPNIHCQDSGFGSSSDRPPPGDNRANNSRKSGVTTRQQHHFQGGENSSSISCASSKYSYNTRGSCSNSTVTTDVSEESLSITSTTTRPTSTDSNKSTHPSTSRSACRSSTAGSTSRASRGRATPRSAPSSASRTQTARPMPRSTPRNRTARSTPSSATQTSVTKSTPGSTPRTGTTRSKPGIVTRSTPGSAHGTNRATRGVSSAGDGSAASSKLRPRRATCRGSADRRRSSVSAARGSRTRQMITRSTSMLMSSSACPGGSWDRLLQRKMKQVGSDKDVIDTDQQHQGNVDSSESQTLKRARSASILEETPNGIQQARKRARRI